MNHNSCDKTSAGTPASKMAMALQMIETLCAQLPAGSSEKGLARDLRGMLAGIAEEQADLLAALRVASEYFAKTAPESGRAIAARTAIAKAQPAA